VGGERGIAISRTKGDVPPGGVEALLLCKIAGGTERESPGPQALSAIGEGVGSAVDADGGLGSEQVQTYWASCFLKVQGYPFLVLDAMHLRVRRQAAVRSTTAMLAVCINEAGQGERVWSRQLSGFDETAEG
jgi:hypothetical protein